MQDSKSDLHYYNLYRKNNNQEPVTQEWYDDHLKDVTQQVQQEKQSLQDDQQVIVCLLTRQKFSSLENFHKFQNQSNYQSLLKDNGLKAPSPQYIDKQLIRDGDIDIFDVLQKDLEIDIPYTDQDQKISLFDFHQSKSIKENLEYMEKKYNFKIPDAEICQTQELLEYLGCKLIEANVPLYVSGLDDYPTRFESLDAVLQNMKQTNRCYMLYENNEEEYEEFYDYSKLKTKDTSSVVEPKAKVNPDNELTITGADGKKKKLGNRGYKQYYNQRKTALKPEKDANQQKAAEMREKRLGYKNLSSSDQKGQKENFNRQAEDQQRQQLKVGQNNNLINKIPQKNMANKRAFNFP